MGKKAKGSAKGSKDEVKIKDLPPKKETDEAVKGGRSFRITNIRSNATAASGGPSGTPGAIQGPDKK
ncbi:MAG: hypothetical protein ACXW2X_00500 [Thermoanaerobaculia bacterium]